MDKQELISKLKRIQYDLAQLSLTDIYEGATLSQVCAKRIYNEFYIICQEYTEEIQCSIQAKVCALKHVDLIPKSLLDINYAILVKQEIEKL